MCYAITGCNQTCTKREWVERLCEQDISGNAVVHLQALDDKPRVSFKLFLLAFFDINRSKDLAIKLIL